MTLNTAPRTWVAGEIVTAAEMNTEIRDALTGIQAAWTSWTPVLTAATTNPTLGSGSSQVGNYLQIGKFIIAAGRVAFGTSGVSAGSGRYSMSVPVTAATGTVLSMGVGIYTDSSGPTTFTILPRLASSTTFFMYLDNQTSGTFGVSSSAPVAPAASDSFDFLLVYQAA